MTDRKDSDSDSDAALHWLRKEITSRQFTDRPVSGILELAVTLIPKDGVKPQDPSAARLWSRTKAHVLREVHRYLGAADKLARVMSVNGHPVSVPFVRQNPNSAQLFTTSGYNDCIKVAYLKAITRRVNKEFAARIAASASAPAPAPDTSEEHPWHIFAKVSLAFILAQPLDYPLLHIEVPAVAFV